MKIIAFTLLVCLYTNGVIAQSRFQDPATGKWGYQDREWNIIAPAIYDEVQPNFDTIMAVKKDGKMGAIDEKGRYRIPLIYEKIEPNLPGFPSQYGYAAVTRNYKMPNTWGMVDGRGKVILPEKFRYVRAITPQLLVGKVDVDSFYQFYDLRGRLLYKIVGRRLSPIEMDNLCFSVEGYDHKDRAYKLDGKPVYPPDPTAGVWTNGELTILSKGRYEKGVINSKGETVIPFEYFRIKHGLPGHFIAVKVDEQFMPVSTGVYDYAGKIVVPFAKQSIVVFGKTYLVYDETKDDLGGMLAADGAQILPMQYRFSTVHVSENGYGKIPDSHPERYLMVYQTEPRRQFLIRNDGLVIRPEGSSQVTYLSEKHALIVEMAPFDPQQPELKMAVDLKGNVLLPPEYLLLQFTADPKVLIGKKTLAGRVGFIPLEAPQKAEFIYDYYSRFYNGYYRVQVGRTYELYNPQLKRIHSGEYEWVNEPDQSQHDQFRFSKKTKEKLVAVAFRQGMVYGEWLGITESGKDFLFKQPEQPPVKAERPSAKEEVVEVMEEAPPVVETDEAPPPVEAPPPPAVETPDMIFNMFDIQEPPEFPGGKDSLNQYLIRNLKYPRLAAENGIQGMVAIKFVIEKDGSISNITLVRDIGGGCGQEAKRLVESMPKWTPGKKNGQKVRVEYTMPVRFKLE
ncbi:MAG: TonB family protein [Saprospiraceae bacterium]|nr:TonB family protein [Saprospiraceae bacterium]